MPGVARALGVGDFRQRRVQQRVAGGRRVHDFELAQIRVDAVLQRQIHQHAADQRVAHRLLRHTGEPAARVVQQQEHDFFGEAQHGGP